MHIVSLHISSSRHAADRLTFTYHIHRSLPLQLCFKSEPIFVLLYRFGSVVQLTPAVHAKISVVPLVQVRMRAYTLIFAWLHLVGRRESLKGRKDRRYADAHFDRRITTCQLHRLCLRDQPIDSSVCISRAAIFNTRLRQLQYRRLQTRIFQLMKIQ